MAIRLPEGSAESSASHQRAFAFVHDLLGLALPSSFVARFSAERLQKIGGPLMAALGTVCREFLSLC
jgi:hypothetical protein